MIKSLPCSLFSLLVQCRDIFSFISVTSICSIPSMSRVDSVPVWDSRKLTLLMNFFYFQGGLFILLYYVSHWISEFVLAYQVQIPFPHLISWVIISDFLFTLLLLMLLNQTSSPRTNARSIFFYCSLTNYITTLLNPFLNFFFFLVFDLLLERNLSSCIVSVHGRTWLIPSLQREVRIRITTIFFRIGTHR